MILSEFFQQVFYSVFYDFLNVKFVVSSNALVLNI